MARSLTSLPKEILKLMVDELGNEHYRLVIPLAQTFNKVIYDACSLHLELRQAYLAKRRAICDVFEKDEPGWFMYGRSLNLPEYDGSLLWLDDMIRDMDKYEDEPQASRDSGRDDVSLPFKQCTTTFFRKALESLILQTEAVGCELPRAFIKFFARHRLYECLLLDGWDDALSPVLHKVHHRKGTTGYLIQFRADNCGSGILYLYLDPGPAKGSGVVAANEFAYDIPRDLKGDHIGLTEGDLEGIDLSLDENKDINERVRNGDLPLERYDDLYEVLRIVDAKGKTHLACHWFHDLQLELETTDFETWLAGQMFYGGLEFMSLDRWKIKFPPGSLRRAKFHEFLNANKRLCKPGIFPE